jgi:hypothetical protein
VVILPVDQDDLGRRLAEGLRREQTAETGADDDDSGTDDPTTSADP